MLAYGELFFIQTYCCPILFIDLMLFSYSGNTPFVSARPSPLGQILASGPSVHERAKPAVSIFEVLLTFIRKVLKRSKHKASALDSSSLNCIAWLMIHCYFFNSITLLVSNRLIITII